MPAAQLAVAILQRGGRRCGSRPGVVAVATVCALSLFLLLLLLISCPSSAASAGAGAGGGIGSAPAAAAFWRRTRRPPPPPPTLLSTSSEEICAGLSRMVGTIGNTRRSVRRPTLRGGHGGHTGTGNGRGRRRRRPAGSGGGSGGGGSGDDASTLASLWRRTTRRAATWGDEIRNRDRDRAGDPAGDVRGGHLHLHRHRHREETEHALSSSIRSQELETRIGDLAREFQPVVKGRGLLREIDLDRLLKACRKFEKTVRDAGQGQSARDLEANIRKVETVRRAAPQRCRGTVSSLLEYEKGTMIHQIHHHHNEPKKSGSTRQQQPAKAAIPTKLADPSAAIGLLWIRRSISFQYRFYEQLLESETRTPREAAAAAYERELQPYHGWALRKVYAAGLRSHVPASRHEVFAKLGGYYHPHHRRGDRRLSVRAGGGRHHATATATKQANPYGEAEEVATKRDLLLLLDVWRPLIARWKEIYADLDLEDDSRV